MKPPQRLKYGRLVKDPQSMNDQFNAREALQNPSRAEAADKLGHQRAFHKVQPSRFRSEKFGRPQPQSEVQQPIRRALAGPEALHPLCSSRSVNRAAAHSGAVRALDDPCSHETQPVFSSDCLNHRTCIRSCSKYHERRVDAAQPTLWHRAVQRFCRCTRRLRGRRNVEP